MKQKPPIESESETIRPWTRPVSYRWSLPDGTICHGSSVIMSRSKAGLRSAYRRFWQQQTHVSPEVA